MGQFSPIPPSGKKFEITVIDILHFTDGKFIEHWGVPDRLGLMDQPVMKPPPNFIMRIMSMIG
jgi:predicted ester cyclase